MAEEQNKNAELIRFPQQNEVVITIHIPMEVCEAIEKGEGWERLYRCLTALPDKGIDNKPQNPEKEWYTTKEMMQFGYSKRRLLELYHKPKQKYARKRNGAKKNSPIEFNLPLLREAELKDIEMQTRARERRPGICC